MQSTNKQNNNSNNNNKWFIKSSLLDDNSGDGESDSSQETDDETTSDQENEEQIQFSDNDTDTDTDIEKEEVDQSTNLRDLTTQNMQFHKLARKIKTQTDNLQSRLQSIRYDSLFIRQLRQTYSSFTLFANLRCGQWYFDSFDDFCYFKSTDGHFGQWEFSVMRLNINVLLSAYSTNGNSNGNHGLIIVDSTRRGKSFPDALSKMVPIWVAVMNRLIYQFCNQGIGEKDDDDDENDEKPKLELPHWLSKNETSQIEARMDRFVSKALEKTIDWRDFFQNRHRDLMQGNRNKGNGRVKYMKCLWVHKGKDFEFSNLLQHGDTQLDFIPIVCVSASDPHFPEKSFSWRYIPGAGDDHETWAKGLTPQLFYEHADYILEDRITVEETERRIEEVVSKANSAESRSNAQDQTMMIGIGPSPHCLHLGKNSMIHGGNGGNVLSSLGNIAVIMCQDPDEINRTELDNDSSNDNALLLRLPIKDHKKYKNCLGQHLNRAIEFASRHLQQRRSLLITDDTGTNECVALLVGIMCATFVQSTDKGMPYVFDRSSGSTTPSDDADSSAAIGGIKVDTSQLTKVNIRQRLSYVQSYHNKANPSRHLMKQLNRAYLS